MLLGLQERPVGEQALPAAHPDAGRGVRPSQLLGAKQDTSLLHRLDVLDPRLAEFIVRTWLAPGAE
jgi:hypothetical protein